MALLSDYRNGNYRVQLYDDGTRIMKTDDNHFAAAFPDNIDLKITDRCDGHCPMCHESSTPDGTHADLDAPFLWHLHAGTELAIGGGDAFCHPGLEDLLRKMKAQGVICNATVSEKHLPRYADCICHFWEEGLLYGLGVSVKDLSDDTVRFASRHDKVVLHAICGIADAGKLLSVPADDLRLLVLGYKLHGRGKDYFSPAVLYNMADFSKHLPRLCEKYAVVSFDNLALRQLRVRERVPEQTWDRTYCGGDGTDNLYVDLVRGVFALSSRADEVFPLLPTAEQMLDFLHQNILLKKTKIK